MSKLKAMRDDTSTDRQAKVAKFREIQDASNTKIKAILTPEQTGQFDKLRQDARAKLKKKQDQ
jgi:Spy/CpxP family protein refolding chaperone